MNLLSSHLSAIPLKHFIKNSFVRYLSRGNDYYNVLGLTSQATQIQIKDSFYKLSKLYHPDRNTSKNAAVMFQDISEAYEILGNYKKRKQYDRGLIHPDSYGSAKPEEKYEDPEHYKFYKQRLKKKTFHVEESIYDFDAFLRTQYTKNLNKDHANFRKAKLEKSNLENSNESSAGISMLFLMGICLVTALITLPWNDTEINDKKK